MQWGPLWGLTPHVTMHVPMQEMLDAAREERGVLREQLRALQEERAVLELRREELEAQVQQLQEVGEQWQLP